MEEVDNKGTSLDDFKTLRIIGKGNYAKVILIRMLENNRIYALKVIKKTKIL
jgi:serum/glucocorticoid-regulated kinase 2